MSCDPYVASYQFGAEGSFSFLFLFFLVSCHIISFPSISFYFILFHLISFYFISFHFLSHNFFFFFFSDDFIIIACDGVWDEVSDEQAVQLVYESVKENGKDPYLVFISLL